MKTQINLNTARLAYIAIRGEMKMSKETGGSAFPLVAHESHLDDAQGMTLRDMFAGMAIGLFSMKEEDITNMLLGRDPGHDVVAKFCYDLADAMIAERNKP